MWCGAKPWSSSLNLLAPLYRFADHLRYRRHGNVGRRGEDLAHRYLRKKGYIVVARNWRPPQGGGEIDLIAWDGEALVFIEVKSRSRGSGARPSGISTGRRSSCCAAPPAIMCGARRRTIRRAVRCVAIVGEKIEHLREAFPLMPA